MVTKLKEVDAVIVGLGWTGGILAKELTQAGLKVVALERGTLYGGMRAVYYSQGAITLDVRDALTIGSDIAAGAGAVTLNNATVVVAEKSNVSMPPSAVPPLS